jgi:tetratricopeptide (TPR) repeat protein
VAAGRQRRLLVVAAGVVLVALGVRSMVRNPDWKSSSTLLGSAVRDHPESYRAQWTLAIDYTNAGDFPRAAFHFDLAHRIFPRNSEVLTEYAYLRLLQHERYYGQAVAMLEAAWKMHPYVLRTATLLAYGYLATGRFAEALGMIRRVEELGGERAVTMPMRAYASEGLGDWSGAAAAWRAAVRQPGGRSWQHWSFLARALAAAGDEPGAREAVRLAGQYAPSGVAGGAVARLGAAVAAGCYRQEPVPAASSGAAGTAPGAVGPRLDLPRPACDPLGDWLRDVAMQNASPSQSATRQPVQGVPVRPGERP